MKPWGMCDCPGKHTEYAVKSKVRVTGNSTQEQVKEEGSTTET